LAIGVCLAEAGLNDAPLFVLESISARHAGRHASGRRTLLLLWRSHTRLRVHGAIRAGHVERRVGAIAHVAVAVWWRTRHVAWEKGCRDMCTNVMWP
jgi:hypothetical protein